jgi:hypothetical protein
MHQQIRAATPRSSPPDLARLLSVLRDAGINIIAVGGSNHERDGEFGFAVDHDQQQAALDALAGARPPIKARVVDVEVAWLEDRPGALLAAVQKANQANRRGNRLIRDIAVGVPDGQGRVPVQIYYDEGP